MTSTGIEIEQTQQTREQVPSSCKGQGQDHHAHPVQVKARVTATMPISFIDKNQTSILREI